MSKLTKDESRTRMLEVRKDVANYIQGNTSLRNLGEMPNNLPDARRVIVATQDLLENSSDRHRKASDHVFYLKTRMEHQKTVYSFMFDLANDENKRLEAQVSEIKLLLDAANDECSRLSEGWTKANTEAHDLREVIDDLEGKIDASLITIKTVMGS